MYESKKERPLPRTRFARRLASHLLVALCLLAVSLGIGILGYVWLEGFSLIDAFLNAAMLLGGMGPTGPPIETWGGKLFAGCYALYAGLVFIVTAALVFTPIAHRLLHKFHWDSKL